MRRFKMICVVLVSVLIYLNRGGILLSGAATWITDFYVGITSYAAGDTMDSSACTQMNGMNSILM